MQLRSLNKNLLKKVKATQVLISKPKETIPENSCYCISLSKKINKIIKPKNIIYSPKKFEI